MPTANMQPERNSEHLNALNQALLHTAVYLVRSSDWQQDICSVLQTLGTAIDVDRISLVHFAETKCLFICEWHSETYIDQAGQFQFSQIPVQSDECRTFLENHSRIALPQNKEINKPVQPLDYETQIVAIPIGGETGWGWLVLENYQEQHTWNPVELEMLGAAAALIFAAIQRSDQARAVISSEVRLRTLFEQIPAIVYTAEITDNPHITWVSPQVEKYLGWRSDEYLDDPDRWLGQVCLEDRQRVQKSLNAAILTKSAFSVECRIHTKTGTPIWFRHDASLIFDTAGKPHYIQGVLQDIHQGKTVAAELNRLYHEEHIQRLMVEGLTVTSSALSATMDIEKIPDLLLQELAHILPYDTATFWFIEGNQLVLSRARGYSMVFGDDVDRLLSKRLDLQNAAFLKLILEHGRPLIFEKDVQTFNQVPHPFSRHIRSWVGAPILVQGKPFGVFTIESRESGHFKDNIRSIVSAICAQASLSFQNAQLFTAEKILRTRAELLQKATASLTAELDLPQLLEQVMDYLAGVIAFDSACLFLYEKDNDAMRAVAGRGFIKPDDVIGKLYSANNALFALISQQKKPLILEDTLGDPRFDRWGDAEKIRGWMGVPLICREKVIGYMTIDSYTANTYNEEAAQFAQAFANQAASAIQISQLFSQMQSLALTDPLTGVLNRRQFFELAGQLITEARKKKQTLSAIMIDVDHYKKVNDTHGHLSGDRILKVVCDCFATVLQPADILARVGGDEFTILLPNQNRTQAEIVAERLRSTLENASIVVNNAKVAVTASFGVAEINSELMDLDDLIKRADMALYQSKNSGRNTVS